VPGRLRIADLLAGLSIASDLGFGLPPEESMRSCLVATALARKLGLGEHDVRDTFYATLLFHVGCTSVAHETSATYGDERVVTREAARITDLRDTFSTFLPAVTRGLGPLRSARVALHTVVRGNAFARLHDTASCEVAASTARRLGLGAGIERALQEIFESWKGGWAPRGLAGGEISLAARIARVGSEAAMFDSLGGEDAAVHAIRRRAGSTLDPSISSTFAAHAGELLAEARAGDPRDRVLEVEPEPFLERDADELPAVAAAFADLADLKTPFTHGHSREVARIATAAAKGLHLDARTVERLEVAALLHDVGRAAVSNVIWEKPGALTAAEWEQVRMHPYQSERILATSRSLEPMASIAGMHHERLDGSGYHRSCRARELPPAARVLAAADVFQAMTQDRPHRPARTADEAGEELTKQARAGLLDADCVTAVLEAAGQRRRGRSSDLRPAGLTEREVEVVRLVAAGLSNPQIAARLVISRRTAEHHVQHVYRKVGVSSRAALALFALEHDLVSSAADE
jgi:HD-GYP domain-containing protein (c-di-GMP phosphodiesterase class II)